MTEPLTDQPSDAREALLTDLAERALDAVQPEIDRLRTNLTTVFHQLKAAERGHRATLAGCCVMLGMPENTAEPDVFEAIRRLRADLVEMTGLHSNALAALYRDDVETDPHLPDLFADGLHGLYEWEDQPEPDQAPPELVDRCVRIVQPAFGKLTQERDSLSAELEQARAKIRAVEQARCWTNGDGKRFVFAEDLLAAVQLAPACSCAAEPVHQAGCPAA